MPNFKIDYENKLKAVWINVNKVDRKKWTGKCKDWGQIHSQLEISFADRLPQ